MKLLNTAEIGINQKELEIFIDHEAFEAECEKAYRKYSRLPQRKSTAQNDRKNVWSRCFL